MLLFCNPRKIYAMKWNKMKYPIGTIRIFFLSRYLSRYFLSGYLPDIIGSAEALPILCVRYFRWEREIQRERERERERERRKWRHHCRAKLAMNLHFPLPKIRSFRFSLHTSRLSLHGEVTIVALKFAMGSQFPLPKFFSLSLFPLFQMARAAWRVIENPRQMIKFSPVLFCSSHRKNESN